MKQNCIVTLANHRGNYWAAQERLVQSLLDVGYEGAILAFRSEGEVGAPPHISNPYAFKVYCFEKALKAGYKNILYLDSSVYAIRPIDSIFETIEKDGYVMQEAGYMVYDFCNKRTLDYFGLDVQSAQIPMYGNAGLLGLKLENTGDCYCPECTKTIGDEFLKLWRGSMLDGMFKGEWTGPDRHRHDMTCGSIIANQLGMKYQPGDEILQYAAPEDPVQNETIIFKAQGI